jgi:hypothetical protein
VRSALAALLVLMAAPALADDWQRYENRTYGYAVDVPPGLVWRGESGTGDGQDFTSPTATLSLSGKMTPDGFEAAVRDWRDWEAGQGWNIVFEAVTPAAARVSARRAGWLMEMRALNLCGDALVTLQLEYGTADVAAMQPVLDRLAASFTATRRC